jgi:hypothetical protein
MSSAAILTQSVYESLRNRYLIEYLLEEVRVTFKSDVKISLNDINIDAKEGDILPLPRWLTKIMLKRI